MAHHVAALLQEAEGATGNDKSAKEAELREAILALWAHRFELPTKKRPFGEFESILNALASLDPESKTARYFPGNRVPDDESAESKETREWIELARALDHAARALVGYCLATAAASALDKGKEWVELAKGAGIEDSFEFHVIRFIKEQSDLQKEPDPNAHARRVLKDRQKKLEAFLSMASALEHDLKARLDSLPPAGDEPEDILFSDLRDS